MGRLTAEDIAVKTKIISTIEVTTYCDTCEKETGGCILVQNWMHGSLYVCKECRATAGIVTEPERILGIMEKEEKEKRSNAEKSE